MNYTYKKAGPADLELLTETRVEVLRAANQLGRETDMTLVERESCRYYKEHLGDGSHVGILVFEQDLFIGAGGISFFQVMPTYHNPSGRKAYIMNMYTRPGYRRRRIAFRVLDLLVAEARERGISSISLEATDMGRPLYLKYGFVPMEDEMELP